MGGTNARLPNGRKVSHPGHFDPPVPLEFIAEWQAIVEGKGAVSDRQKGREH